MTRADFVNLPVHSGRPLVVNLHSINANVACARFRIARVHVRQGNETAAIFRPAFQDGQISQRKLIVDLMYDLLARAFFHLFRPRVQQVNSLFEQSKTFAQIGRWFCLEDKLNFLRNFVRALASQGHGDSPARSHRIDGHRKFRFCPIDNRLLEQKRLAPAGRFHFPVGPCRDEQIGINREGDAFQFACLLKRFNEFSE